MYALDDEFVLPIINLCFSEVKIHGTAKLDAVGAVLSTRPRKQLAMSGAFARGTNGTNHVFNNGMYRQVSIEHDIINKCVDIPNMRHIPIVIDDIFQKMKDQVLLPALKQLPMLLTASRYSIPPNVRDLLNVELRSRFRVDGDALTVFAFGYNPKYIADDAEYVLYIHLAHLTLGASGGNAAFKREIILPLRGRAILFHRKSNHYFEPLFVGEQRTFGIAFGLKRHIQVDGVKTPYRTHLIEFPLTPERE